MSNKQRNNCEWKSYCAGELVFIDTLVNSFFLFILSCNARSKRSFIGNLVDESLIYAEC